MTPSEYAKELKSSGYAQSIITGSLTKEQILKARKLMDASIDFITERMAEDGVTDVGHKEMRFVEVLLSFPVSMALKSYGDLF